MVGQIVCKQFPGDRVEKEKVSIFVDKCTVMLFMGVFQGNVKKIFRKSTCWTNYCSSHESKEPFSKPITSNPAASVFCYRNFAEGDVANFLFFSFFNGLFDSCDDKCTPQMACFFTWWTHSEMCFSLSMRTLDLIFCMIMSSLTHIWLLVPLL